MRNYLTILLMLAAGLARGQTYPNAVFRADITGYKGNTVQSDSITVLPSDTAKGLDVVVSYREGGAPVQALKPTLIKKGLKVVIRWNLSPPFTDGWYRLLAGGQTIRDGAVHITTQGVILPNTSANLITSIIAQLAQTFGTGKLDVSTFNAFVNANTIALGLKFNTADTTAFVRKYAGYRLMSAAEGVKLAGLPDGATYTANRSADQLATTNAQNAANAALSTANSATTTAASNATVIAANAVAINKLQPRFFNSLVEALAARSTAMPVPQQWIVPSDTTYRINGVPQYQSYEWDGNDLYYGAKQKANGSPGTPSYNTQIDNINTTLSAKLGRVRVTSTSGVTGTPTALTVYEVDTDTNTQGKAFYFLDSTGQKHIILTAPITTP